MAQEILAAAACGFAGGVVAGFLHDWLKARSADQNDSAPAGRSTSSGPVLIRRNRAKTKPKVNDDFAASRAEQEREQ